MLVFADMDFPLSCTSSISFYSCIWKCKLPKPELYWVRSFRFLFWWYMYWLWILPALLDLAPWSSCKSQVYLLHWHLTNLVTMWTDPSHLPSLFLLKLGDKIYTHLRDGKVGLPQLILMLSFAFPSPRPAGPVCVRWRERPCPLLWSPPPPLAVCRVTKMQSWRLRG